MLVGDGLQAAVVLQQLLDVLLDPLHLQHLLAQLPLQRLLTALALLQQPRQLTRLARDIKRSSKERAQEKERIETGGEGARPQKVVKGLGAGKRREDGITGKTEQKNPTASWKKKKLI